MTGARRERARLRRKDSKLLVMGSLNMEDGIAIFSCKALIVGCGLSGLATAIALRRSGHEVIIFERMPELREVS